MGERTAERLGRKHVGLMQWGKSLHFSKLLLLISKIVITCTFLTINGLYVNLVHRRLSRNGILY